MLLSAAFSLRFSPFFGAAADIFAIFAAFAFYVRRFFFCFRRFDDCFAIHMFAIAISLFYAAPIQ